MSMKPKQPDKLTNQLRSVVLDSGITLGELSRQTGIDKSALSRFLSGERTVSSKVLDVLGEFFQLRFIVGRKYGKAEGR
jgi:transcriptional regulator with XRE-family HTH domain